MTHAYETVGAAIKARLEQCTILQGAETNLGAKVYRGRRNITDDQMPCAVLVEGEADAGDRRGGRAVQYAIKANYALHAYVPCDPDDPNVAAHAALRDMKRRVLADSTLTGLAQARDVEFKSTDIAPRVDGAAFVLAVLTIAVTLYEDMATP